MTNGSTALTCILPISKENKISPIIEIKTAKRISPMKVLVFKFWPRELKHVRGNFSS